MEDRTLPATEKEQPRKRRVAEHFDDQERVDERALLRGASSTLGALGAVAHCCERKHCARSDGVCEGPPANCNQLFATHFIDTALDGERRQWIERDVSSGWKVDASFTEVFRIRGGPLGARSRVAEERSTDPARNPSRQPMMT